MVGLLPTTGNEQSSRPPSGRTEGHHLSKTDSSFFPVVQRPKEWGRKVVYRKRNLDPSKIPCPSKTSTEGNRQLVVEKNSTSWGTTQVAEEIHKDEVGVQNDSGRVERYLLPESLKKVTGVRKRTTGSPLGTFSQPLLHDHD